jgi:hypothetical protein
MSIASRTANADDCPVVGGNASLNSACRSLSDRRQLRGCRRQCIAQLGGRPRSVRRQWRGHTHSLAVHMSPLLERAAGRYRSDGSVRLDGLDGSDIGRKGCVGWLDGSARLCGHAKGRRRSLGTCKGRKHVQRSGVSPRAFRAADYLVRCCRKGLEPGRVCGR